MVDTTYIALGERVRALREKRHLTQEALADQVGLSRTSVTNIERGRQAVLVHQLLLFAKALDAKLTDLVPDDGASSAVIRSAPADEIADYMSRLKRIRA